MDGSIRIIEWEKFIDSLCERYPSEALALTCAFSRGDYLYDYDFSLFFNDNEIRNILTQKFQKVNTYNLHFKATDLEPYIYGEQDNPFKELQTDTEIYYNKIYAITDNALFKTTAHRNIRKYPVSTRPQKLWDCSILSLKASKYGNIALSGGRDGLFEYEANNFSQNGNLRRVDSKVYQISEEHSSFSDWSYSSVYSSSQISKCFIAVFNWIDNLSSDDFFSRDRAFRSSRKGRKFEGFFYDNQIFHSEDRGALSWGCGDKIYRAKGNYIEIAKFNQYKTRETTEFEKLFNYVDKIHLQAWKGNIISAGISFFGSIIECENALVVLKSDGEFVNIPGQSTRWRVYPRSKRYENHLHVIFDDRLVIYSFNQDYFVDQLTKKYGMYYNRKRN
ncbi:MAG: hypothetical protein L0Y79_06970 [Chlorobi bacterium]|nr:hypothetical protein [Chlorobiota bacterium]MCI0715910.1 hypothetical protein [Chlorobiota bacterium]